jgi:ribosomal protein L11 methyltransferase
MTSGLGEGRLWRASFSAPATAMPGLLETLEPIASSISIFEDEANELAETTRWRVDMMFAAKPDREWLARELQQLCAPFGFRPETSSVESIPEADWLSVTAMQAQPVRVGRFLVHGGSAANGVPPGLLSIQVEAGLAFGSGEHATTQACLEALDRLAGRRFRSVLDLGCGSGVLAMGAARISTATVVAVDNDPVAVRVAAQNIVINGLAGRIRVGLSEGWNSSLVRRRAPYDLVLANILADPLCEMAGVLARNLSRGGMAVLSGFIVRDADRVADAHRRHGLRVRLRIERQPWCALVLEMPAHRGRH